MTDQLRQMETKLVYYNDMYRKGTPVVADQVFDALLEEFEKRASAEDYKRVRESMFSAKGKIRHQYVIGSLRKTKAEDDSSTKWLDKENGQSYFIVEKIDGMSIVLHFVNGKFVKAVSRGDGEYGEDYTDKVRHIVKDLLEDFTGQIRAELLLPKSGLKQINDNGYTYKNPRNAVVGIVGTDTLNLSLLKKCNIIAYQIMGSSLDKVGQYARLERLGFDLPRSEMMTRTFGNMSPNGLKSIYENWQTLSDYEIDGLVIHNLDEKDENQKLPVHTIAFKVNDLVATTKVIGIEWNLRGSKKVKPVVLIDPIDLGGATIRRATGNNVQWILDREITVGSIVTIEKAGDIIPKIIDIVPDRAGKYDIPTVCPACGHTLGRQGVDLVCINNSCTGNNVQNLNSFLRACGIEGISEKSLVNLNVDTIDKLLNFMPRGGSHTENKLMDELFAKVFVKTKVELICCLPFNGFGKKTIQKIMETYGKNRMAHTNIPVDGLSADRMADFKAQFADLVKWVEKITHDNRWAPQTVKKPASPVSSKLNGLSFCFTGKLETMSRGEAELYAKANGAEVKPVSNKLTYLVTNNPNSGSGKNKKAAQLGVQIITEKQFCDLIGRKYVTKTTAVDTANTLFDINSL